MTIPNKPDAPVSEETVAPDDQETVAPDDLDQQIDYEGIVARTEADRDAARVLSREQMRARTDKKLAQLRARRRSA